MVTSGIGSLITVLKTPALGLQKDIAIKASEMLVNKAVDKVSSVVSPKVEKKLDIKV